MNCLSCGTAIDAGSKVMQMPCCDIAYHPQCGINRLFTGGYYDPVMCDCGTLLHDSPYNSNYSSSHTTSIEEGNALLETEEIKPKVMQLKKKMTEWSKASGEFDRFVKTEADEFKESIREQLEAIHALKEAKIAQVKEGPEYKAMNKAKLSFNLLMGKFQKSHPTIPGCCLRDKIGRMNLMRRRRYWSSLYQLKRKFSLRKWYM
jgi:hypothetical protein